jgi:hypothetical protein
MQQIHFFPRKRAPRALLAGLLMLAAGYFSQCRVADISCEQSDIFCDLNAFWLYTRFNRVPHDYNGDRVADLALPQVEAAGATGGQVKLLAGGSGFFGGTTDQVVFTGSTVLGFGGTVAGLDFNGDGIEDLAVGAPLENASDGAVYIFYGGGNFFQAGRTSDQADVHLVGELLGTGFFGLQMDRAGDVNGDGIDDLIVCAGDSDGSGTRVYIFFGSPARKGTIDASAADVIFHGSPDIGPAVAGVGDINGDGLDDVAISSRRAEFSGTQQGMAMVFIGRRAWASPLTQDDANLRLIGQIGDNLGDYIAGADLNRDGYNDLIVSSMIGPTAFPGGFFSVVLGGPALFQQPSVFLSDVAFNTFSADVVGSRLGSRISIIPDVSGDGYPEILAGSAERDGGTGVNIAYLFAFHPNRPGNFTVSAAALTIPGSAGSFAFDFASPGDLNGDGNFDFLVSAPGFDGLVTNGGLVRIFSGYANGNLPATISDTDSLLLFQGTIAEDNVGFDSQQWYDSSKP